MKCLVFSDSHGYSFFMRRAISNHPDAEVVFFLGDGLSDLEDVFPMYPNKKFLAVRGNCDSAVIAMGQGIKKIDHIELMGKKIVFTHGDLYGVKFGIDGLCRLANDTNADIILFGHTHSPVSAYIPQESTAEADEAPAEKPFYIFNPGSVGMLGAPTYGVMTLTEGEPLFSHGSFL